MLIHFKLFNQTFSYIFVRKFGLIQPKVITLEGGE